MKTGALVSLSVEVVLENFLTIVNHVLEIDTRISEMGNVITDHFSQQGVHDFAALSSELKQAIRQSFVDSLDHKAWKTFKDGLQIVTFALFQSYEDDHLEQALLDKAKYLFSTLSSKLLFADLVSETLASLTDLQLTLQISKENCF